MMDGNLHGSYSQKKIYPAMHVLPVSLFLGLSRFNCLTNRQQLGLPAKISNSGRDGRRFGHGRDTRAPTHTIYYKLATSSCRVGRLKQGRWPKKPAAENPYGYLSQRVIHVLISSSSVNKPLILRLFLVVAHTVLAEGSLAQRSSVVTPTRSTAVSL